MSLDLASDMDKLLEEKAEAINGQKPHVSCFISSVHYYNAFYSKKSPCSVVSGIADNAYAWVKYFAETISIPGLAIPVGIKAIMQTKAIFMGFYAFFFSFVTGAWYEKRIADDSSTGQLKGFNRNLDQFRSAYPMDKLPAMEAEKVPPAKEQSYIMGAVSETASRWNPFTKSSMPEKMLVKKMVSQDTDEVIRMLTKLKDKKGKVDGGRLLDGYQKLGRYPDDSRETVLGLLFDLLPTVQHLEGAIDIQLASGIKGRACVRKLIDDQADLWLHGGKPKQEQYEAAIFAAAKLGDVELLDKLLSIKVAASEFAAAGLWKQIHKNGTSFLHAAIESKIPGSSEKKAVMVRKIYEEIVKAHRLDMDTQPLKDVRSFDPLSVSKDGKLPLERMSPNEASALDKEFHLNPQLPGSFTSAAAKLAREKYRDLTSHALIGAVRHGLIGSLARPIADVLGFAVALSVANFGPAAMFVADVGTRMLVIKMFAVVGATTHSFLGKGFSRSLNQLENDLYTSSSGITQLGRTQQELEEGLAESAEKRAKDIQALERETDMITYKYLLEGLDQAIEVAGETGDFLSKKDLESIRKEIAKMPQDTPSEMLANMLKHSLAGSDISVSLRLIISLTPRLCPC